MNYQVSKIILASVVLVAIATMGEVVVGDAGHTKMPKERLDAMKSGKRASDVDVAADRERRLRNRMEAMRAAATVNRSKEDAHVSKNANPRHDSFRHEASDREIKDLLISATAPICDFDARGDSGDPQFESVFWATMLFNSGMAIMPSKNMINNVGASADSSHYSEFKTMPRRLKQLFTMKRYDLDFPLRHPRYVIEEVGYWKRMYKTNGWGYPWVKIGRSLEELWLNLRYGNVRFITKSIARRLRILTGQEKFS